MKCVKALFDIDMKHFPVLEVAQFTSYINSNFPGVNSNLEL